MNKLLKSVALCICISLQSCAQNKNEIKNDTTNMEKIEYQKEGLEFSLKYRHKNCSYEILVNDMPVITHFGIGERSGLTVYINQYILKAGKQDITIRMFPAKSDENSFKELLDENSGVSIEVAKKKAPISPLDELNAESKGETIKWEVLNYTTPKIEKPTSHIEFKTSFVVDSKDINWKITGWSKSKDLRNDPNLRKEVETFYDDYKKVLEEGNQAKYLSLVNTTIYEQAASTPWDKEAETQIKKEMGNYATEKRNFLYPCKNAELKYFGNGKVVTLVCTDIQTFGYSPLISKTAKNMMPKAHTFYLHKPEGSNKLEIIR